MNDIVINVDSLGKRYSLRHLSGPATLRERLTHLLHTPSRWLRSSPESASPEREDFWALRDINFSIRRGEVVGIIGRNGAGKSTLLKILSRITEPTTGRVRLRGRVASLLEVGTGFHPELTGRENISLNGAILGMSRDEIRRKFDEIVAFAEIERFIDTPVKHYSSGMYVRLAFAVAAHLEPEILIIDEVLAVGDATFQKKCLGKMKSVAANEGRTVLFVSHNISAIQTLCTRGLLLEGGRLAHSGAIRDTVSRYLESGSECFGERVWTDGAEAPGDPALLRVRALRILDSEGALAGVVPVESAFGVEIDFELLAPVARLWVGFLVHTLAGDIVFCSGDQNFTDEPERLRTPGRYRSLGTVPANLLNEDRYTLSLLCLIPGIREIARAEHILRFDTSQRDAIAGGGRQPGFVRPVLRWQTSPLPPFHDL